jgi:hypothetical protein
MKGISAATNPKKRGYKLPNNATGEKHPTQWNSTQATLVLALWYSKAARHPTRLPQSPQSPKPNPTQPTNGLGLGPILEPTMGFGLFFWAHGPSWAPNRGPSINKQCKHTDFPVVHNLCIFCLESWVIHLQILVFT